MRKGFEIHEQQIVESQNDDAPILVFVNPDADEKKFLVDTMKVDEHTLSSALDPDESSRLEFEPDHIAIIFKRPRNVSVRDQLLFKTASTGVFLFQERLVIVLADEITFFEKRHFRRVSRLPEVMLKVVYGSVVHFLEHLRAINMVVEELETKINTAMENRYLINLFALEKSMVYYLSAINSNMVLIEKLRNYSSKLGFSVAEQEFLEDMMVDNGQCYKQADIYSSILASMMDARASIVGNNLNLLMKLLNLITIGIMVPTFVVSAFSMNVLLPFGLTNQNPVAFWIIMALALLSVIAFYTFWRRRGW
jgi:magnesium transporter